VVPVANIDHGAPIYPIGSVQKLTGLSGRQIRYYEQQNLLQPKRTKGNQRIYSHHDVDVLICIKQLLAKGYNLAGIRSYLASQQNEGDSISTASPPSALVNSPNKWSMQSKLASLYPVNNQAALAQLLETRRATSTRCYLGGNHLEQNV